VGHSYYGTRCHRHPAEADGHSMRSSDARTIFESLVRAHAADLYRFAFRLLGEAQGAEDLVQEAYHHAWRSVESLRDPAAGRAWLLTILRRRWSRRLRDESRRRGPRLEERDVDQSASPLPGPDIDLLARREWVQDALNRLDPRLKETFLLVFLEGLSCREAAERLGSPLGTVLSRVHRARVALRVLLRDVSDEEDAPGMTTRALPGGRS